VTELTASAEPANEHPGPVRAVAYSPDGARLASGGMDGAVRVWDAHTGAVMLTLARHRGWVNAVAYSPDGGSLASGGSDGAVRVWDARTGALTRTLARHGGLVNAVAYSPDGDGLVSGGIDGVVRVIDVSAGAAKLTLAGHEGEVRAVAYSPDGLRLASGSSDGTVRVWHARTGAAMLTLARDGRPVSDDEGQGGTVRTVAYSPDGLRLASGSSDGTVRVWDARTGALTLTLADHPGPVNAVAYSPDGASLASGGSDGAVRVWDTRTGALTLTLADHVGPVNAVAYSPDGADLASGGDDGVVRIRDIGAAIKALAVSAESSDAGREVPAEPGMARYRKEPVGRDFYTTIDTAGYASYAEAIVRVVQHKETQPPLTIGIKGAWGAGKTSLMRMVQERLEWPTGDPTESDKPNLRPIELRPKARELAFPNRRKPEGELRPVRNWTVLRRLKAMRRPQDEEPARIAADPTLDPVENPQMDPDRLGWRPTVWFNPWMYQTGEQVWAGLAYEVIKQVTGRMRAAEREHFWLRLNLKRVDEQVVRRKIYGLVVGRLVPFAIGVLLLAFCGLALIAVHISRWITVALAGGAPAVFAVVATFQAIRVLTAHVSGSMSQLVRPVTGQSPLLTEAGHGVYKEIIESPDYRTRVGFFHLVRSDVQRVLDLVATEQRPIVVFVDDLDRCSPGTVVQVIEAINLFLAGEYPNSIFVVAMEPELVAAHIKAAYSKVAQALNEAGAVDERSADLGWRFLEKIVQLPLTLPAMGSERTMSYFESLFGPEAISSSDEVQAEESTVPDRILQLPGASLSEAIRITSTFPQPEGTSAIATAEAQVLRQVIDQQLSIDNTEVKTVISFAIQWLAANPREIKRFVNVFRFLVMIDSERGLQQFPSIGDLNAIAKIAVLHIRWPGLITALGKAVVAPGRPIVYELLEDSSWVVTVDGATALKGLEEILLRSGLGKQVTERLLAPDLREFIIAKPSIGALAGSYL
jgi:WD40 repeat protein